MLRLLPLAFGALLAWAGCGAMGPPLPAFPAPGSGPRAAELREALRSTAAAAPDSNLVDRLRRGGLTPAFGARFQLASGAVVAFVPGRHPARGEELVVAVAERGTPGAAALLEDARLLAARAAYSVVPERTVLVAFLPARAGAAGLAAVLDAPVWTRPQVVAVLLVGAEEDGGYEAVGAGRGVPVQLLPPPQGTRPEAAAALAQTLQVELDRLANGAPALPDVGAPPADSLRARSNGGP